MEPANDRLATTHLEASFKPNEFTDSNITTAHLEASRQAANNWQERSEAAKPYSKVKWHDAMKTSKAVQSYDKTEPSEAAKTPTCLSKDGQQSAEPLQQTIELLAILNKNPELLSVIERWPKIPAAMRLGIVAIVESAK